MNLKINSTIFISILGLWFCPGVFAAGTCNSTACSAGGTSPWTAASASYADVNHCVNTCAEPCVGEVCPVVIVPAGSETWNSYLTITKGIALAGAGIGKTILTTGTAWGSYNGLIKIVPTENKPIRVTGFTFNGNLKSQAFWLINNSITKYTKIRIDHNRITNVYPSAMKIRGPIYGVIDNNVFDLSGNMHAFDFEGMGGEWGNFTQEYGSENNMYVEDNTITGRVLYATNGGGGRYAIRYNTFINSGTSTIYAFDAHGNQGLTYNNTATMVTEIYGNSFDYKGGSGGFLDHRGGWALLFNNMFTNVGATLYHYVREESADNMHGSAYVMKPTNSYYWRNLKNNATELTVDYAYLTGAHGENCCTKREAWQPNHTYGGYCAYITGDPNGNCWRTTDNVTWTTGGPSASEGKEPVWKDHPNLKDVIQDNQVGWVNMGAGTPFTENGDLFIQKTGTFDGTGVTGGGVGCGTLASRPTTCTTGVGYWATSQSCSDLTGIVGANPATPISGTLYKCTATNTWTAYYTPYRYPHPLTRPMGPRIPTDK